MKEWEVEEVSGNHPGTPVTIDAEEREESSSGPTDAADADDRTEFARLEALATVEEQENARRWAFMAGLGLLVTAVSTVWWWWVTPAPTAMAAGSAPRLVWVGLLSAATALAHVRLRPERRPGLATAIVLIGALVVGVRSAFGTMHEVPGPAPWLALCGALITFTSVAVDLMRVDLDEPTSALGPRPARGGARARPANGRAGRGRRGRSPWADLVARVAALPPPWGAGDRLAIASLVVLLVAGALPWGTKPHNAEPVMLAQAVNVGPLVLATLVGVVLVTISVAGRSTSTSPYPAMTAGGAAVVASLPVRLGPETPLPLFTLGRGAAVVGGLGLVVASVMRMAAAQAVAQGDDVGLPSDPESRRQVRLSRRLQGTPAPVRRDARAGVALALVVVGAATLAGTWWRSPFRLHGPALWPDRQNGPLIDAGRSAAVVRSGIDAVGPLAVWVVAGAVVFAGVVAVAFGVRRATPAVVAAAAALGAGAVTGLAGGLAGGTATPWLVSIVCAVAAAVAGHAHWSCAAGPVRYLVVPAVLLGLSATVVVDDPAEPVAPGSDGPYQVLVGEIPGRQAGDAGTTGGGSADEMRPHKALWSSDEPAFATASNHGLVLSVVRDGRVELHGLSIGGLASSSSEPYMSPLDGFADDTLVIDDRAVGYGRLALWRVDSRSWRLPAGTTAASLGPDGRVWMLGGPSLYGALHVATVDDLTTDAGESSTITDWPEVPVDAALGGATISSVRAGEGAALAVVRDDDTSRLVRVGQDGSLRTVLGGVPDPRCGLNRQAATSSVALGRTDVPLRPDGSRVASALLLPLDAAVPASDGGIWLIVPAAQPVGDRVHALGRIDPDGTVRRVDHALPPLTSIAPSPDGDSVLVVDRYGRLLRLDDAASHAEPLPPADCHTETPIVAPPAQLTAIPGAAQDGTLLDTHGTRLRIDDGYDQSPDMVRITADGREEVVFSGPEDVYRAVVLPDGAGGAWWLATTERHGTYGDMVVQPVHLLASGDADLSAEKIEVGPLSEGIPASVGIWAAGDAAYVMDYGTRPGQPAATRLTRVAAGTSQAVHHAGDRGTLSRDGSLEVVPGGHLLHQTRGSVVRVLPDRTEVLVGGGTSNGHSLPIQLADGRRPDQLALDGDLATAPGGDGVLLVQDGLLVHIGLDGSVTPLAQDARLAGNVRLLDGRVVVDDDAGTSYVVELP